MLATLTPIASANGSSHNEVGKVILIPRTRIRPFADQPRKFFDQQKLKELGLAYFMILQWKLMEIS